MREDNYIEFPREKITFYGDTENEKKANELLFDMGLELSALDDELKEKDKEIDRLNNIISQIETLVINHNCDTGDIYYKYNGKYLKSELKERIMELVELKEDNK